MSHRSGVAVMGPLAPFADGFWEELSGLGFAPGTAKEHLRLMGQLSRWLQAHGLGPSALTPDAVEQFLGTRRAMGYARLRSNRAMLPLLEHLRGIGAVGTPGAVAPCPHDALIAEYVSYLRRERALAGSTVKRYQAVARLFMTTAAASGPAVLGPRDVTGFVSKRCTGRSTGYAKNLVGGLRAFLRFLHLSGLARSALVGAVPAVAGWRGATLPSAFEHKDVVALLASCDRQLPVGRRDYAVLSLLVRLGLRAGEVAGLRLEDFHWAQGEVLVRGKGNRHERLPLPKDVGGAVVGYITGGRPSIGHRELFLRSRAPIGGLSANAVSLVVRHACRRAGLAPVGAHALRHSTAREMLRVGVAVPDIAQVLRHASTTTTAVYLKVDRDTLRLLAEPWPGAGR
jgi:integrase/recombinase XerD